MLKELARLRTAPTCEVERTFSKMARTFLRHIRVDSFDELKGASKGIDEVNVSPLVFR